MTANWDWNLPGYCPIFPETFLPLSFQNLTCFMPTVTNSSSLFQAAPLTLALHTLLVQIYLFYFQSLMQRELSSSYPTESKRLPSGENLRRTIARKWNWLKLANTSLVSTSHTKISMHFAFPA